MNILCIFSILFFLNPDNSNWIPYYKNTQIEISYKKSDCFDKANGINQRKITLKFQNLTNKKIEISFSKKLIYTKNNKEYVITPDKSVFKIQISPGAFVEGTCENHDSKFFIFEKFLDRMESELKSFDLENINVTELE